jgi:hypothetical protein
MAAKEFFSATLAKQKELSSISLPNLALEGATLSTLISEVILRAPSTGEDISIDKDQGLNFSGCYKQLRILNLAGNSIDSDFDAKTLYSIFDFLESLEELNLERLKFDNFKSFKK